MSTPTRLNTTEVVMVAELAGLTVTLLGHLLEWLMAKKAAGSTGTLLELTVAWRMYDHGHHRSADGRYGFSDQAAGEMHGEKPHAKPIPRLSWRLMWKFLN
jgi:hypothetical protein